jgi:hypothetical protein
MIEAMVPELLQWRVGWIRWRQICVDGPMALTRGWNNWACNIALITALPLFFLTTQIALFAAVLSTLPGLHAAAAVKCIT